MASPTEPVYLRVLDDLRSKISSGSLQPGARVPSRNAIITNYGVGETAAKHALAVLLAEGLIEARPGSGCYVRKAPAVGILEHDRPAFPGSPFGVAQAVLAGAEHGECSGRDPRQPASPRPPGGSPGSIRLSRSRPRRRSPGNCSFRSARSRR